MRLILIAASLALSALVAFLTHGQVLFLALPLLIGLPLAGLLKGRR